MSDTSCAPEGAASYRLAVEATPDANVLLRLLEPFVIHDVLPHRIESALTETGLAVELDFSAAPELAERLEARLRAMVPVHDVAMVPLAWQPAARLTAAA